jgi:hypothetical protein
MIDILLLDHQALSPEFLGCEICDLFASGSAKRLVGAPIEMSLVDRRAPTGDWYAARPQASLELEAAEFSALTNRLRPRDIRVIPA